MTETEYVTSPFFDYHAAGDKNCDACYATPIRYLVCGGLLHNHLETASDGTNYTIMWRCDSCGGDHQDEEVE